MKLSKKLYTIIAIAFIVLVCSGCDIPEPDSVPSIKFPSLPKPTTEEEASIDLTRENYNVGSCYNMQEDICYLVVFLNDDKSSWSEKNKDNFIENKLTPSLDFLKNNATEYDVTLDDTHKIYTKEDDSAITYDGVIATDIVANGSQDDILNQVAKSMGYNSPKKMNKALQKELNVKQVAYLIVVNKEGRSYKYAHVESTKEKYEYCVFFNQSIIYDGKNCSSTIAHEILHLFGAEDYYDPYGDYPKREKLAKKLYPNDIMRESYKNVNNAEIGAYTAYSVGWTNEMPEECNVPDWWK